MILTTFALGLCFILNLCHTSVLAEESDNAYLRRDFGPCRHPLQRREWCVIIRFLVEPQL